MPVPWMVWVCPPPHCRTLLDVREAAHCGAAASAVHEGIGPTAVVQPSHAEEERTAVDLITAVADAQTT